MFVVSIVPLKRGISIDALSYFSSTTYPIGSIVQVPIRNSIALGLVVESHEVSTTKTALKAATFSLKRLPQQEKVQTLSPALIRTAEALAQYYAHPLGSILFTLLSPEIRNGDIALPHTHYVDTPPGEAPYVLQARMSDRFLTYRSLVRETFAHSGSVLLIVPSSHEADTLREKLAGGIEDRIITLTTASTKTELKRAYAQLDDFSKTKLIIATPSHAIIERHDITLMVVENARSPYYKTLNRPYLNYLDAFTAHAKQSGRKIILADLLPRTEEEYARRNDRYQTYGETPKRIELPGKLEVVEMAPKPEEVGQQFSLLSDTVITAIKETRKKRGNTFLFTARRGLAPLIACLDCGYIFRSKESGAPYSLMRTIKNGVEERWFVCGTSGERIRAQETCTACGSWRLRERGIGIQHVHDELHKLFPNTPIMLFDHTTARTYKKAIFLRDTFYKAKGAILLGTHMAVPYLNKPIHLSAIVNMDALLATPTWRIEEENLALLLSLREQTEGTVYIQTRTPPTPLLSYAKQGLVEQFYSEELALRKSFNYPPYSAFVHLTWQGNLETVKALQQHVDTTFKEYGVATYTNPVTSGDAIIMYGLMRIPKSSWPEPGLSARLKALPPQVRVMLDPDRIV